MVLTYEFADVLKHIKTPHRHTNNIKNLNDFYHVFFFKVL